LKILFIFIIIYGIDNTMTTYNMKKEFFSKLIFDINDTVQYSDSLVDEIKSKCNIKSNKDNELGAGRKFASLLQTVYCNRGEDGLRKFKELLLSRCMDDILCIIQGSICHPMFE
ncbi:Hypothetical protein ORPV_161, partial [Orpheovirus IHUMI-LCC2]